MSTITLPEKGTRIGGIPFDKRYNCSIWQFIVYPESAPENWRQNLLELGLKFAVSPLHDKDINPDAEGGPQLKKAHWHILVVWNSPTTWQNAIRIAEGLENSVVPMPCLNVRNRYDYFTHKNDLDPAKHKYDEKDIELYGGFALSDVAKLTGNEVGTLIGETTKLCREQGFTEYADLVFYLLDNNMLNEFDVVSHHTMYFTAVLKGIWRGQQRDARLSHKYAVDVRTGELVERDTLPEELRGEADCNE